MKNSGISGIFTVIIVIVLIARIAMISNRKSGGSANPGWDNTFLIWSIIFLVAIIGSYFYNASKKKNDQE